MLKMKFLALAGIRGRKVVQFQLDSNSIDFVYVVLTIQIRKPHAFQAEIDMITHRAP